MVTDIIKIVIKICDYQGKSVDNSNPPLLKQRLSILPEHFVIEACSWQSWSQIGGNCAGVHFTFGANGSRESLKSLTTLNSLIFNRNALDRGQIGRRPLQDNPSAPSYVLSVFSDSNLPPHRNAPTARESFDISFI